MVSSVVSEVDSRDARFRRALPELPRECDDDFIGPSSPCCRRALLLEVLWEEEDFTALLPGCSCEEDEAECPRDLLDRLLLLLLL